MKVSYDKGYYDQQGSGYVFDKERRDVFSYHLKKILLLEGKVDSILDIGCGFGYFLHLCERVGIKSVCGLETSDYAIGQARRYTKADIRKFGDADHLFADRQFPVVTAFDVVEHLEEEREMFKFAYERLRPGGLFYGTTPNVRWFLRRAGRWHPTHFNVHDRSYWSNLLSEAGFWDVNLRLVLLFGFPPFQRLRQRLGITCIRPVFTSIERLGQEILFSARK